MNDDSITLARLERWPGYRPIVRVDRRHMSLNSRYACRSRNDIYLNHVRLFGNVLEQRRGTERVGSRLRAHRRNTRGEERKNGRRAPAEGGDRPTLRPMPAGRRWRNTIQRGLLYDTPSHVTLPLRTAYRLRYRSIGRSAADPRCGLKRLRRVPNAVDSNYSFGPWPQVSVKQPVRTGRAYTPTPGIDAAGCALPV